MKPCKAAIIRSWLLHIPKINRFIDTSAHITSDWIQITYFPAFFLFLTSHSGMPKMKIWHPKWRYLRRWADSSWLRVKKSDSSQFLTQLTRVSQLRPTALVGTDCTVQGPYLFDVRTKEGGGGGWHNQWLGKGSLCRVVSTGQSQMRTGGGVNIPKNANVIYG